MTMDGARREGLGWLAWLWLGGILAAGALCPAASVSSEENSKKEQALRTRIEEFYILLQQGNWFQAESYLTEESKELLRTQPKGALLGSSPVVGFNVESVTLDPDGQGATAVVRLQTFTQFSTNPVAMPRISRWRLVNGAWYLVLPKPESNSTQGSLINQKTFAQPKPKPEELKFKGHRFGFGILQPGQIKTARFPFTNVTDHAVKLAEVLTACECLKVKTEKREYKPGESGELVIEFDPTGYEHFYYQTIVVKTEPGTVISHLDVEAYVALRPREAPKTEGEAKPATKP